jgi:hypothetical protein
LNGAVGKTEAVVDLSNPGIITHNIWGNDLVGLPAVVLRFLHPPMVSEVEPEGGTFSTAISLAVRTKSGSLSSALPA